jgi:hypothetical protein
MELKDFRRQYTKGGLRRSALPEQPMALFEQVAGRCDGSRARRSNRLRCGDCAPWWHGAPTLCTSKRGR